MNKRNISTRQLFLCFISLPKSLYVCLNLLPFKQACRIPILVHYRCKLLDVSGTCEFKRGCKFGSFSFGFGSISEVDSTDQIPILKVSGTISVSAPIRFGPGSRLINEKNAFLSLGRSFLNSAKITISNCGRICIGDEFLSSWDTWIVDTNYHQIMDLSTKEIRKSAGTIIIGNHVWLGARSVIQKGAQIPDGCIIGSCSLVNKIIEGSNLLLAGTPACPKRNNVEYIL